MDFTGTNGIVMVSATPDMAMAYVDLTAKSLNIYGNAHGGLLFSLADHAAGICARAGGANHVTLQGNMNYLTSVSIGRILATAKTIRRGRTTCIIDVNITDDKSNLIAKGTFTMYRI